MTSIPLLLAQLDALQEDLSEVKPFEMVALTEFGIVSGYAPTYAGLRVDAIETLGICVRYFPELPIDIASVAEITPQQHVNEGRLTAELQRLIDIVRQTHAALTELTPIAAQRLAAVDANDRRRFAELLSRSGIKVAPRKGGGASGGDNGESLLKLARDQLSAPSEDEEPARFNTQKIFISSRFSFRLGHQIADVLSDAGYDPVLPRSNDATTVMDKCSGGVFSLMSDGASPVESAPPVRPIVFEVASAPDRLRQKMLLVGREATVHKMPPPLSEMPFFGLKNEVMDETEMARFAAVTSLPSWRSHNKSLN
ncbi:MAG: hypothetical protein MRY74_05295 [Neomegalonema sp.]|nr:hypothetical protein [Neomegalonema sp.]